ncbi:helix-turn-helix transcriptional regulator [Nocardiopsis tropica]|uniref:Helix-turn-helix transcriptional regulator n=1 Tax=Nocardiopsis tropica TaxID=109330 RepID=A0ABU7KP60_9ACTN|nr:helix-turn-helix transcriptional regulator [Nocardiopsis umidischolae]MEE2051091.1 helix-turn-helix transcriptional regulator [Nocardiopsis umidischolae]
MDSSSEHPVWSRNLHTARTVRGWDPLRLAQETAYAVGRGATETPRSLVRRIRDWEAGRYGPGERYLLPLARVLDVPPEDLAVGARAKRVEADRIRATSAHLVSLDGTPDGTDLVPAAVRAARTARTAARSCASPDVVSAAAEALQVAGWLAFDADEHVLARRLTSASVVTARAGGDRGGELFALAQLAMHDAHEHRPSQAHQVCEHVLDQKLSPRLACLFELRLARAHGQSNTPVRALATLRRARSRFQEGAGDHDPHWTWWIVDSELTCHEAMIHVDDGRWDRAQELFASAREHCPPHNPRGPLIYAVHQLHALVRLRAWTAAQEVLTTAVVPLVGQVRSGRVDAVLARTARLGAEASAPAPFRELMRVAVAAVR